MRARHNLSLLVSCVYLVAVLLVPASHVVEAVRGEPSHGGACVRFASSGTLLQLPCRSDGPCTNPHHHHHSGQPHDAAPCPRCSGFFGPAVDNHCGSVITAVEYEQPVHSPGWVFISLTLANVKAPRAPPFTV